MWFHFKFAFFSINFGRFHFNSNWTLKKIKNKIVTILILVSNLQNQQNRETHTHTHIPCICQYYFDRIFRLIFENRNESVVFRALLCAAQCGVAKEKSMHKYWKWFFGWFVKDASLHGIAQILLYTPVRETVKHSSRNILSKHFAQIIIFVLRW